MPEGPKQSTAVLFVCLGNICRSPLAAGVFQHLAAARNAADRFVVDSGGLGGWHAGEPADPRSIAVARKYGIELNGRARRVAPATDFARFDLLVPMDIANRRGLLELGALPQRVRMMRSFDPDLAGVAEARLEVPDPYTGGAREFEDVYRMLVGACEGMLDELLRRRG